MEAAFEAILVELITLLLKDVIAPDIVTVSEDAITGKLQQPATQIIDSTPDLPTDTEVTNEVQNSIDAGLTPAA
jgi:hypothetical protein